MMDKHSFMTVVTAFFMCYLDIDDSLYNSFGELTESGAQICAKYLIDKCVFNDEKDMKAEALKTFDIILPHWIFEYKRSDNNAE